MIPTRDRRDTLMATLAVLDQQAIAPDLAEIVVVDNGSDGAGAAVATAVTSGPARRVVRSDAAGPAAARNRGVDAARAPVVLFLGDDMAPAGVDLLARHMELHRHRPEVDYAVLGRATWRPDRPITPFMHWLEHGGPQFDFAQLAAGPVAADTHLITAHVSIKREMLRRVGGFDERFTRAAAEDNEIGIRLADAGLTLDYHPELVVLHDHPTTLDASRDRMRGVGQSARLLHELHPDRVGRPHPGPRRRWRAYPLAAALARATLAIRSPRRVRERAWHVLMLDAYARGYRS